MNAGDGINGSTIKWNLKKNAKHFDRVIVVDGDLTEEAKAFYDSIPNCEYVDSPWKDSYVDQYRAFATLLNEGEWCLYLDCDEVPSESLVEFCKNHQPSDENMVLLPCVLHITEDGSRYYPAEPQPSQTYEKQWTKHILFKKTDTLSFRFFGSHVIPTHGAAQKSIYAPHPYYHMKSLESFVYNDVWQAYLHPQGQGYDPVEAARFKMFVRQFKTTQEFKKATKEGKWPAPLIRFAHDHALEFDRPISRLAWVYWILEGHPNIWSTPVGLLTWEKVKDHVLSKDSMDRIKQNKEKGNFIEI